ncbi:hypothetical protein AUC69_11050 [Methyloceanibacter superfactus]|jgi:hypothetical protein|uniref:Uncharacterized protein n=1 Tax=Methyloceanibacter superfactus TaxID=1774969 RepID=A0A1E3VVS4_9HYPH|nr:hypothetical protein AUC69_11050 [Methyloceanibacter superfactus]
MANTEGPKLVYQLDLELAQSEIDRIKEVLRFATLSELARLDASRDLKVTPLTGNELGVGPTIGWLIRD